MRRITLLSMLLCLCVGFLAAQNGPTAEGPAPAFDVSDLESFLDGVVEGRMKNHHTAGVTVSIVYGGEMIFAKGYGYADVENLVLVDAATTLFRPGSISKTFTWTAVMQLVEQGKLDLDEDIRTYLGDLEIPTTFPEPITMLDLMAHAPGFEDTMLGHLFGNDPDNVLTLEDYLATYQPARVRSAGEVSAYSNYGSGLAGLIVANVSGMTFEDYVDTNILGPLGMSSSTFREPWTNLDLAPMPAALEANSSKGYTWKDGGYEAGVFEFIHQVGPAGALSTTATDMARFMLMHLGQGTYGGVQILAPETAQVMQERHFGHDEAVNGWAHGLLEYRVNGYRGIGHAGGTLYFISQMVLIPELDFGLFASANTSTGADVVFDLHEMVVERFFPPGVETTDLKPPAGFKDRADRFVGTYISNRRNYTLLEKLPLLFLSQVSVTATDDGYLVIKDPTSAVKIVEVESLVFRALESGQMFKFVEDSGGSITGFVSDIPIQRMDRASTSEETTNIVIVVVISLLACVLVLTGAWYRRKQTIEQSGGERFASFAIVTTSATWLLFFVVFGIAVGGLTADNNAAVFEFPTPPLVWSLVIALVGVVVTLVCVALLIPVWRRRNWSLGRRIRHSLAVVIFIELVLILNSLNVIGFKYF